MLAIFTLHRTFALALEDVTTYDIQALELSVSPSMKSKHNGFLSLKGTSSKERRQGKPSVGRLRYITSQTPVT